MHNSYFLNLALPGSNNSSDNFANQQRDLKKRPFS
jgi:hypothetical protein